jgi:hypothetical protein
MKRVGKFTLLRWLSLGLIVAAVVLLVFQLVVFSRLRSTFSPGTKIAGVEVTGLDQDTAAERLTQVYSVPVELRYGDQLIQAKPAALGFTLDLTSMMTAADQARVSQPFWISFFNYLFNQLPASPEVPLRAKIDESRLSDYLTNEIAARYDIESSTYVPVAGSVSFEQGEAGHILDIERSVSLVTAALKSPTARVVNLTVNQGSATRPSMDLLHVLLQQIVDDNNFTGEVEIYVQDLESGNDMQVAYRMGEPLTPDIAFTAVSTIKIPIMVSIYQHVKEPTSKNVADLFEEMIAESNNTATDELMRVVLDPNLGPIEVTKTVKALGLKNTFLDGMFYSGAPLLTGGIKTPANTRTDINTDPDPYSQTTPTDVGLLLADIYECAQTGGGTLIAVFPGDISQNECKSMISYLTQNRIGVLLEAGLPDGTQIGHKHGWAEEADGLMHTVGDAGLVYSPGGNYVIAIFIHDTNQIVWDSANHLFADLSRAVYNYFNIQ